MRVERTKNAVRNITWGVIDRIITLIIPFITRTVMIKVIGAEYLGLSSLFTSILSVLSITELGFGTAIVFSMYKPIAEDDKELLCALLNTYKKIYNVVGTVILIAGLIIAPFLRYLIRGDYPSDVNIYILYLIYLFNTVISYFLYAYKVSLFHAYQRNDLISKRQAIISLISNVLKIIALLLMRNYYAYVIIIPITTVITNLVNAYLSTKLFPEIQAKGEISKNQKEEIKKRVIGLVSFKIYNVVFVTVDTIIISAFLGLRILAIYNNYYYVQNAIVGFLSIITASITAGIGNKMITNSVEDNYRDFKNFVFANGWIVSWCSVCLACLYQPFMKIWVGDDLMFPKTTMLLMVCYFLLPRITTMTYTYREAAGLWWEDRFRPIVATIVNLIGNIILVQVIGMNGVIISTLVCTVFINIPWGSYVLFKNYFRRSAFDYYVKILFYVAITIVTYILTNLCCSLVTGDTFLHLIIKGAICILISNIIFWIVYHRLPEYQYMTRFVTGMINKIKNRVLEHS